MRQGLISKRVIQGGRFAFMPNPTNAIVSDPNGYVRINKNILETKSTALGKTAYNWYTLVLALEGYAEVMFEAKRVSGSSDISQAGGIGYNRFNNTDAPLAGNLIDWKKIESDEWKTYHLAIPPDPNNPFIVLAIGCFTNTIGEYHFRRIEINTFNERMDSPSVRFAEISGSGNNWYIAQGQNSTSYYGIHTVTPYTNYLELKYHDVNSWNKPVIFGNILATTNRYGWQVQFRDITRSSCRMYIYNHSGIGQAFTSLTDPTRIHVGIMA